MNTTEILWRLVRFRQFVKQKKWVNANTMLVSVESLLGYLHDHGENRVLPFPSRPSRVAKRT